MSIPTKESLRNDLLDEMYAICCVKRPPTREELGWDGKSKCPYCDRRYESLSALDHHIDFVHGNHE